MEQRWQRAGLWLAGVLLVVGLLAEGTAIWQGRGEELPLAAPLRLSSPARLMLRPFGVEVPRPPWEEAPLPGAEPADGVWLPVENILQLPELPNGCEVTSLSMVLQSLGYAGATNTYLAEHNMPQGWLYEYRGVLYASDPTYFYVGDPSSEYGYYMLAPALAATANSYISEQGGGCVATDISGAGEEELEALLRGGTPVIVWNTMDYGPARYGQTWVLEETGQLYAPYVNLHCQVLVGADGEYFYVNDPLTAGAQPVPRAKFMYAYRALGSQAVIVTRRSHVAEQVVIDPL